MKRWHWFLIAALVIASLVVERFVHHHHDYWFYSVPGYFVMYGFVGCVAIIFLSKWYGKYGVQRGEDYYDRYGDQDEHQVMTEAAGNAPPTTEPGDEEGGA